MYGNGQAEPKQFMVSGGIHGKYVHLKKQSDGSTLQGSSPSS